MRCMNINSAVSSIEFKQILHNYAIYCTCFLHIIRVKRCTAESFLFNFYELVDILTHAQNRPHPHFYNAN